MGQTIISCAAKMPDINIVGKIDIGDSLEKVIDDADVVIDFSSHNVTPSVASLCTKRLKALVIGTTGHSPGEKALIETSFSVIPVVWTSNFSCGVNTLFWLVRKAAEVLNQDFDIEIIEMHHRLKKDAPSGTALTLANIAASARGYNTEHSIIHGRSGITGERPQAEIGVHALRGGDVVGDHTVIFAGLGERLELTHKASSRETFALGALRAAKWITGQKPGLYTMLDVLGLK